MPRVRDVLYRFRPAAAPGAATAAGVPVDRGADVAAELEPLFRRLAATEQQCADILDTAERDAAAVRERDGQRARALVAAARGRVDAERAAVAARLRKRDEETGAATLAAAEHEAERLRHGAEEQIATYVDVLAAGVRDLITADEPMNAAMTEAT